ncbi:hypothetical protein LR48_Vigan10g245900 [Vigna angularis]|uniref:Helicase C-terminal domain-containing protein n=2 Tax=Phaseolus angularis TaxID=3914 RepID=A0A0L9VNU8_PHAAN|nr:hypothetical protein LR48_Vigan10g245900 [Vigna angularis]
MAEPSTAAATTTAVDPPPPVTKRWADEADEETEASSTATATEASSVNLDSLKIEDNDENPPKLLDDPDDSSIQKVTSGETPYTSAAKFEDLNLSPELLKGLYVEMKFQKPSKIQAISLPMILVLLFSATFNDTVKNFVSRTVKEDHNKLFVKKEELSLDAVKQYKVYCSDELAKIEVIKDYIFEIGENVGQTIIFVRTRNSAQMLHKSLVDMGYEVTSIQGALGHDEREKIVKEFRDGLTQVLISTDLLARGFDQQQDGFKDDSLRIMKEIEKVNSNCQVLLVSATFNDTVKNFVSRTVKEDHNKLFVKKEELSLDAVKQYKVYCSDELAKIEVIKDYIFEIGENVGQTIIFVRTRNSAQMLHKSLVDMGYEVTSIQGALGHDEREKIVKEFRDGLTQVLISTDLLARGFDQQQVNLVINYDLPMKHTASYTREPEPDCEVYLHRVGRAGRFGRKGAVFNLICDEKDERLMSKIENHFGTRVAEVRAESVEDYRGALKEAGLLQ